MDTDRIPMIYLLTMVTALTITIALVPPLTRLARQWRLVDIPDERKVHACIVPRIGGVAMVAGAVIPLLMWASLDSMSIALLGGVAVIAIFGVWDDRKNLDYRLKFLGQLVAVLIVVLYGDVVVRYLPFMNGEPIPDYVAIPLTIFALLGVTNAINLADGLDGLAGGLTLISLCAVGVLAFQAEGVALVVMTLAVLGGLLGFLRFNTWPARIFMGDCGSQFLGFCLGVLVVELTQEVNASVSPVLALYLIGIPLLDTVQVLVQRIVAGRPPFSADRGHMHHKFLDLGFGHYEAVFFLYLGQAVLVSFGYVFRYQSDALLTSAYVLFALIILGYGWLAPHVSWLRKPQRLPDESLVGRMLVWIRQSGLTSTGPLIISNALVSVLFLGVALTAQEIPQDISWVALGLLVLLLSPLLLRRSGTVSRLEQVAIYSTCTLVVYLLAWYPGALGGAAGYIDAALVVLALAMLVGIRFTRNNSFQVTPMDFLVLFIALVVPNLPGVGFHEVGHAAARLIVLFYAIEFVWGMLRQRRWVLRLATLGTLALLALRGVAGEALPGL